MGNRNAIILVVDDNPTNLGVLFDTLESASFKVRVATHGQMALAGAIQAPPDLILLDVMMPGLDGFETCRRLKANVITQDIPVIFMTALTEPVDEMKGFQVGAVDYITKPFQIETVLARIETHLKLRNLQKDLQRKNNQLQQEITERKQAETALKKSHHKLRRASERLATLYEIGQLLTSQLQLETILDILARSATKLLGGEACIIWLVDKATQKLDIKGAYGLDDHILEQPQTKFGRDMAKYVISTGESLVINNFSKEKTFDNSVALEEGFFACACVALTVNSETIGSLGVYSKIRHRNFNEQTIQLLKMLAHQAAIAIRNAHQMERIEKALYEVGLLYRTGSIVAKAIDVEQGIEQSFGEYLSALNLKQGGIFLLEQQRVRLYTSYINDEPQTTEFHLHSVPPLLQKITQSQKPMAITEVPNFSLSAHDQRIFLTPEVKSCLLVPLLARGQVIGFLSAETTEVFYSFTQREMDLAQTIADQIATAVENVRLFREEQLQRRLVERQNKELDAFAHTVAHDLKNPLSVMVTYSDYLLRAARELETKELLHSLTIIKRSARMGANIVNELLLLASVRREDISFNPLDMSYIIRQVQQRLSLMIEEYEGKIILPHRWPTAQGYAPWIEEIWANYLSNGLKYGGKPPRLHLDAKIQADGMIRFWVQDNGPGLSQEEQAKLFNEFARLDEIHVNGHGLGLSIVYQIVEKLGGKVGVESTPGQGCLFYFTLPKVSPHQKPD